MAKISAGATTATVTSLPKETSSDPTTNTITIPKNLSPESVDLIKEFFSDTEISDTFPNYKYNDFYSHLVCNVIKADLILRGHVSCVVSVLPPVVNGYNGLHGGAVAAIAERLAIACARTVVALDKQLFLGELSMSYLSVAPLNEVLVADGSVMRSGRNLTVVSIEFKIKKTQKLVYMARATLYHMPVAKL